MVGVSLEQAVALILEQTRPIQRIEPVELLDCLGRILAEDMIATQDNPPFDPSAIDGYACRSGDLVGATSEHPVQLQVIGEVDAGQYTTQPVAEGQAYRIMTGGAIPPGCDCCLRQEYTDYGESVVTVYQPVTAGTDYRHRGEDFRAGTLMLKQGQKLSYIEAGILASMGVAQVPVYAQPKIALITSGDELVEPGHPLVPGKIYNSNQTLLLARMKEFGFTPLVVETVNDEAPVVAEALRQVVDQVDVIITTGGVSVGKKDALHETLKLLEIERIFWKVAMKPGSPTLFSAYKGRPVVSLSGNPFGAAVNFELLLRPLLATMTRDSSLTPQRQTATMAGSFPKASPRRRFIRGILKGGQVYMPEGLHASGVLGSLLGCNCMVDIPAGASALQPGDEVTVVLT